MNPNTNCLEGMRCPHCQSYGPFNIAAKIIVEVHDNGTDDCLGSEYEWEDGAYCQCAACAYNGTISDFTEENQADSAPSIDGGFTN